ncbi:hypothetical protein [Bacillus licheniformis]|uniref:hypothetical protein n=1 Tax=Bacillus licheniformis TaxID=1402 RepID=UPI0011A57FDD|nr:hypothetical protein [Bacillus licheniformis]TWJ96542.1 hypothetical protein CHCC20487_0872 [Bacillus licheniformis]
MNNQIINRHFELLIADFVLYDQTVDYREPTEVLHLGDDIALEVNEAYLTLYRMRGKEGEWEIGEKCEVLYDLPLEFPIGFNFGLTTEEIAKMSVLDFMLFLAQKKEEKL